jgi:hypothetical protein
MTSKELYELHNSILQRAFANLLSFEHYAIADLLQFLANDKEGAFMLHEVVQQAIDEGITLAKATNH